MSVSEEKGIRMIRIAIVEDEESCREQILSFLDRYENERKITFQKSFFCDGIDILDGYNCQYDIVLLDIRMKHMDGMETARKIRKADKNVILIFITNMAEYAIQGYDVEARGFILKPVRYRLFAQQMDRACREIESRKREYLSLQLSSGIRNIDLKEIRYIESREHYLYIHLSEEVIPFYCTIKDMEKRLEGKHFFRCNNGLIVNLSKVENVRSNEVKVCGETLTVSRSRKKEFMDLLTEYMGEGEYV